MKYLNLDEVKEDLDKMILQKTWYIDYKIGTEITGVARFYDLFLEEFQKITFQGYNNIEIKSCYITIKDNIVCSSERRELQCEHACTTPELLKEKKYLGCLVGPNTYTKNAKMPNLIKDFVFNFHFYVNKPYNEIPTVYSFKELKHIGLECRVKDAIIIEKNKLAIRFAENAFFEFAINTDNKCPNIIFR